MRRNLTTGVKYLRRRHLFVLHTSQARTICRCLCDFTQRTKWSVNPRRRSWRIACRSQPINTSRLFPSRKTLATIRPRRSPCLLASCLSCAAETIAHHCSHDRDCAKFDIRASDFASNEAWRCCVRLKSDQVRNAAAAIRCHRWPRTRCIWCCRCLRSVQLDSSATKQVKRFKCMKNQTCSSECLVIVSIHMKNP